MLCLLMGALTCLALGFILAATRARKVDERWLAPAETEAQQFEQRRARQ
jgi:hypothetical protein